MVIVTGSAALGSGACTDRSGPGETVSAGGSADTTAATTDGETTMLNMTSPTSPTSTTSTTSPTSTSAVTSGSESDSGMRLDFGTRPDVNLDPPVGCVDETPAGGFACAADPGQALVYKCTPLPESGQCAEVDTQGLLDATNACFGTECFGPWVWNVACGPDPEVADACCYFLDFEGDTQVCPGRPFLVDGHCRLADTVARSDWGHALALTAVADEHGRAALAAGFAEAAAFEHASVASFSRFTLELLAVGAPASLVAGAVRATAEEIEHARLFFALASYHGGAPVGPGPLDVAGALARVDLESAAVRAAAEGCIAETISAWQAGEAARVTRDPVVAARLAELAEEELQHCELAWRFVRWALDRAPSLRPALRAVFADPARHLPRGPALPDAVDPALLRAHGMLPREDRLRLASEALAQLVAPAARVLLESEPLRRRDSTRMDVVDRAC